jgi:chromosomal replication initiator protein
MLVMYLARKLTRAPLSEIGRSLGRRSHTTVLSAEAKVTEWLSAGRTMAGTRGQLNIADAVRRVQQRLGTG